MRTLMKWPEDEDLRPPPGAVVATSFNHIRLVIGANTEFGPAQVPGSAAACLQMKGMMSRGR
jgi:hypothetical protein